MSIQTLNDQLLLQVPLWRVCALTLSQSIQLWNTEVYVGEKKIRIYILQCTVDVVYKEALFYLTSEQADGWVAENDSLGTSQYPPRPHNTSSN